MSRRRAGALLAVGAVAIGCSAAVLLPRRGRPEARARAADAGSGRRAAGPAGAGALQPPPAVISPLFDSRARFRPGETVALRFRALDDAGAPVTSRALAASISRGRGGEVSRVVAREIGGGIYEVPFTPGEAGPFQLALPSGAAPPLAIRLQVGAGADPPAAPASADDPGSAAEQTGEEERRLRTYRLMRRGGRR